MRTLFLLAVLVLALAACTTPKEKAEVPEDPTPARTCDALSEADKDAIRGVIDESMTVVFSHDVATYCRLYAQNATEISGRGPLPDTYDVEIPFLSRLKYHGVRQHTQINFIPKWNIEYSQIEGNSCRAVAEGAASFDLEGYSEFDGFRAELFGQADRWQISRWRDWMVSSTDDTGVVSVFDPTAQDQEVEQLIKGEAAADELAWALWAARRYDEAFQVLKGSLRTDNTSDARLYSLLVVSADHLEELIPAYRLVAKLYSGNTLPKHIAMTLARIDAGEELMVTCP